MCAFTCVCPRLLAQCGCDFTIGLSSSEWYFDGVASGVKPGDKICFASGTRAGFQLQNIHGTAANPVIITNMCDGQVKIVQPNGVGNVIVTANCSYFRFTGSANPNVQYGFDLSGGVMGANFQGLSTNFEIDHLYVHDTGSCGIQAKTNPTCDPATQRGNFVMQGCSLHDNLVENTYNEGFYIGNSHHDGGVSITCNGVATTVLEHLVQDLQVYNNVVKNSGNESIQIGAARNAVAHHNRIINGGWINTDPAQSNAFQAGSGTEIVCYNNFIDHGGRGWGIIDFGGGGYYFNNIVIGSPIGSGSVFLNDPSVDWDTRGFALIDNTLIRGNDLGITMYSTNPLPSYFYNNIQVGQLLTATSYSFVYFEYKGQSNWVESNNLRTMDITVPKFKNAADSDFHILPGSPAINAGTNVSSWGYNFDFDGNTRPRGTAWDVGAFEYQPAGPQSNAGPNQTIQLPTNSLVLNGSGTSSTGILSYSWTEKSGGPATLAQANTASLTVTGLTQGVYVFELLVTDAGGSSFSDVTVTVLPATINQNPTAVAGGNQTITLPTNSITLNGMGTDPNTGGSISTYAWTQTSGLPGDALSGASTPNLTVTNLSAGVYVFQLTVTDNFGLTGSSTATVTVNAATVVPPPVVSAGNPQTVYLPTNQVTLTGTATQSGGTIASTVWIEKSGAAVTLTGSTTLSLTATGLAAGTYVFRLTATNNVGTSSYADVTVTVFQANQPPIANAGPSQSITLPTNSVSLPGSGTDADGTVVSYSWTEVSGPAATLANANTTTLSVTNMVQGVYVFGLTVTDNQGATGYSQVIVYVNVSAPTLPFRCQRILLTCMDPVSIRVVQS
jgi:hypothetical protein